MHASDRVDAYGHALYHWIYRLFILNYVYCSYHITVLYTLYSYYTECTLFIPHYIIVHCSHHTSACTFFLTPCHYMHILHIIPNFILFVHKVLHHCALHSTLHHWLYTFHVTPHHCTLSLHYTSTCTHLPSNTTPLHTRLTPHHCMYILYHTTPLHPRSSHTTTLHILFTPHH